MKLSPHAAIILLALACPSLPGCHKSVAKETEEHQRIVVTSPAIKDVDSTQQYVCQVHSCRHIEVCALESGYLEQIAVTEGQVVKQDDLMFKIIPTLYQARLESEAAEARLAQIELDNTKRLFQNHVVSPQEVALAEAKLAKAQAQVKLAQTELNFTAVKAPFSGIIDRQRHQLGSLVEEGDILTTLSDNSLLWVYFNVPEVRYLEYKARLAKDQNDIRVDLVLANGEKFQQPGKISAIEGEFNNETGNIAFRADFPNPDGLLRHGQTGNVLIHRTLHDAIVIPQRATFEILDKRFVYVVGKDGVARQREIVVEKEMEDIYVIREGIAKDDKFVLEGVREVHDGEKMDFEFLDPSKVLGNLKNRAE